MVSFRPRLLKPPPEERSLGVHAMEDWEGPRVGLEAVEKKIIFVPAGIKSRFLGRPAHSLSDFTERTNKERKANHCVQYISPGTRT
jgi:hypothetical protein